MTYKIRYLCIGINTSFCGTFIPLEIMQIENLYMLLTFMAAVVMLLLGCMLLGIRIPRREQTAKLRVARLCLALSYFILATPNFIEYFGGTDTDTRTIASFTLATAAFQSLLFTATMLTFILPGYVTRRRTLCQLGAVVVAAAIFLSAAFGCRDPYPVLYIGLAAYLGQITYYTWLFRRKYAESLRRLESYYDDDAHTQLRWVKCGFYAALTVGIAASVSAYFPLSLYSLFTAAYTVFYAWFANRFSNYAAKLNYYLPALAQSVEEPKPIEEQQPQAVNAVIASLTAEELTQKKELLRLALEKWVTDKGYVRQEESKEQIAQELGTEPVFMRWYFSNEMPQDFRSWRIGLRIEYAKKLLAEDPGISMNALAQKIGFNTCSNFYGYFKKVTGETPLKFQKRIADRN